MAPAQTLHADSSVYYEQSLNSAALELKYASSAHLFDIIAKDEDIRKVQFEICLLEDENDELRDQVAQEEERSDSFEKLVNANLVRAEEAEAELEIIVNEVRVNEREIAGLRAEIAALQNLTTNSTAYLTEKLALDRELSALKPEVEHLRSQLANQQEILSEKLSLQRQLNTMQVELENEKCKTQKALAKRRNTQFELSQEEQIDDLRREMTREKRARQRAEEAVETAQAELQKAKKTIERSLIKDAKTSKQDSALEVQVKELQEKLAQEEQQRQEAQEAHEAALTELERVKKAAQLPSAKEAKKAQQDVGADGQLEELQKQMTEEKRERQRAEKALQKGSADWEAQKSIMDDKLNQFRTKLKTTKEKLKEAEEELATAQTAAAARPAGRAGSEKPVAKNPKKRNAAQMEPDATGLGTPGNGMPVKRGKKATATVGDKSTFSITPFLNRTMSMAPESPEAEEPEAGLDKEDDAAPTPTASKTTSSANLKPKPLAPASASKFNIKKTALARKKTVVALEKVAEEAEDEPVAEGKENEPLMGTVKQTLKVKPAAAPTTAANPSKAKMRKSLATFATFNIEPQVEKVKKRKLGGLGKTLFDDDDEGAVRPMPGASAFGGQRLFGRLGGLGALKGKGGLLGARAGLKGGVLSTEYGFQFSPLKKDRKLALAR
ncbi:hypothetical protein LTR50_007062 [Elasticomyces elasticus]|nr:hypothetical protein LTR50_007062 [Elasticomyces elasticus]